MFLSFEALRQDLTQIIRELLQRHALSVFAKVLFDLIKWKLSFQSVKVYKGKLVKAGEVHGYQDLKKKHPLLFTITTCSVTVSFCGIIPENQTLPSRYNTNLSARVSTNRSWCWPFCCPFYPVLCCNLCPFFCLSFSPTLCPAHFLSVTPPMR